MMLHMFQSDSEGKCCFCLCIFLNIPRQRCVVCPQTRESLQLFGGDSVVFLQKEPVIFHFIISFTCTLNPLQFSSQLELVS